MPDKKYECLMITNYQKEKEFWVQPTGCNEITIVKKGKKEYLDDGEGHLYLIESRFGVNDMNEIGPIAGHGGIIKALLPVEEGLALVPEKAREGILHTGFRLRVLAACIELHLQMVHRVPDPAIGGEVLRIGSQIAEVGRGWRIPEKPVGHRKAGALEQCADLVQRHHPRTTTFARPTRRFSARSLAGRM